MRKLLVLSLLLVLCLAACGGESAPTAGESGKGDAAAGEAAFNDVATPACGSCHSLEPGVDLVGPIGAPVRAVLAGTVAEHWLVPGWHWGKRYHGHPVYGAMIVLDHGEGLFSIYGHLSATFVHEGDWIEAGQVIGELGNTGISTGPHLHLEIVVDPLRYLEERS